MEGSLTVKAGYNMLAIILIFNPAYKYMLHIAQKFRSPLHIAAENNHCDIINDLIEAGADIEARDYVCIHFYFLLNYNINYIVLLIDYNIFNASLFVD